MATGEKPFKGDTNVSVISSIIKDTPAPITDSNPNLPADLARIVRRCLAKDPDRRYQTAADLRNELEELKQDTASGTVTIVRSAPRLGGVRGAILAVGLCRRRGSADGLDDRSDPDAAGARMRAAGFTIDRLSRLTTTGSAFMAAISPDGRYVVHVKGGAGRTRPVDAADGDDERRADRRAGRSPVRRRSRSRPTATTSTTAPIRGTAGVASLFKVPVLGGTPATRARRHRQPGDVLTRRTRDRVHARIDDRAARPS